MKKILILTDKINFNDGVTTYLYNFMNLASAQKIKFYLCTPGGDRIFDFKEIAIRVFKSKKFAYENRNLVSALYYISVVIFISLRYKINIIHSQNYYFANIAKIVSKLIGIKTVTTHNNLFAELRLKHFISDINIVVNNHILDHALTKSYVKKESLRLIRYGMNIPTEKIIKVKPIIITAAARLTIEKGLDTFIKAVSLLDISLKKDCLFYIAGEGDYERILKNMNIELNAGIEFLGKLNGISELLKKSWIFVNPSRWDSEGYPLSLIEAGAYKNLVITSNFKGVLSVFSPDQDGFLFEKDDYISLGRILENSIINYELYQNMIDNYYNKVKRIFNINMLVKKTLSLYDALLVK